jgi:hypothetical protein
MKSQIILAAVGVALIIAGCKTYTRPPEQIRSDNANAVSTLFEAQDEQGIIAQRTIYPYHFVSGTSSLNARGVEVLDVLSGYYKEHSGILSIPRRGEEEALHLARVDGIKSFLTDRGVNTNNVYITMEALPVGGVSSHEMRRIMESDRERGAQQGAQGGVAGVMMEALGGAE